MLSPTALSNYQQSSWCSDFINDLDGNTIFDAEELRGIFDSDHIHQEACFKTSNDMSTNLSAPSPRKDWEECALLSHTASSSTTMSHFNETLFGDLCSELTTSSPGNSHSCFSSPTFPGSNYETVAQSIEHDSVATCHPSCTDSGCHAYHDFDKTFQNLEDYGLHSFLPDSALSTPYELVEPAAIDSYFSYQPCSTAQTSRQSSMFSDLDPVYRSSSTALCQSRQGSILGEICSYTPSSTSSRRPTVSRSISIGPVIGSRISKTLNRRISEPSSLRRTPSDSRAEKCFPCPFAHYGCTAAFSSKNEWKRHVSTQHLKLELWRCDLCALANRDARPNDFNRKDLFVQHLRRMHNTDGLFGVARNDGGDVPPALAAAERRCRTRARAPPPVAACLFCDQAFHGPGGWDERMEHVGKHLEQMKRKKAEVPPPGRWRADPVLEHWLLCEEVVAWCDGELKLKR